jgi:deoxyribonuclease-4
LGPGTWDQISSLAEKEAELLIGAHESIAGGVAKAVSRAEEDGCEVIQIFTGSPSRWSVPPVSEDSAREYRYAYGASSLRYTLVHGSYLINPASPDAALWERSLGAIVEEYKRCIAIGADYLIMHPGSSRGSGREESVARVAKIIGHLFTQCDSGPVVLIENTAGAGETLGGDFSDIFGIADRLASPERIGCCFDTAHAFAAGYDLRTPSAVSESLERMQFELGEVLIHALHLNDSARPLGSGVDRHARIGEGLMGTEAFHSLMNRKEFSGLPAVLETQPLPEDEGRYRSQIELLKSLREGVR